MSWGRLKNVGLPAGRFTASNPKDRNTSLPAPFSRRVPPKYGVTES